MIAEAGFQGVQGGDPNLANKYRLGCTGEGRVNQPSEADEFARTQKESGFECAGVHVGWGHESDEECDALVAAIIQASADHDIRYLSKPTIPLLKTPGEPCSSLNAIRCA